jgi:hypothetical protein
LPHISAGWIVSGAADPAVGRNDQGRNFRAYGIGDIAAAEAAIAISVVNAAIAISAVTRAVAVSVVTPAVQIEAAIVTVAVTNKDTMSAITSAVESGDAASMKSAASPKPPVKAAAVKAAAGAASRVSGSGE